VADHVGIYDISGTLMARPTNISRLEELVNASVQERFTVTTSSDLSAYVLVSGSAVGVQTIVEYTYEKGHVSRPQGEDYNYGFVIREYGSRQHEVTRFNAQFSGTEVIESPPKNAVLSSGGYWIPSTSGRVGPSGTVPLVRWYAETRDVFLVKNRGLRYFNHNMKRDLPLTASADTSAYTITGGVQRGLQSIVTATGSDRYGRSVGITDGRQVFPATLSADQASVFTRITGALAVVLAATESSPSWFLGFQSGSFARNTPYLPLSSMSLVTADPNSYGDVEENQRVYAETLGIQMTVPQGNDAASFLNRQDYTKTTLQRWEEAVSSGTE
jgi:hypothetical protein